MHRTAAIWEDLIGPRTLMMDGYINSWYTRRLAPEIEKVEYCLLLSQILVYKVRKNCKQWKWIKDIIGRVYSASGVCWLWLTIVFESTNPNQLKLINTRYVLHKGNQHQKSGILHACLENLAATWAVGIFGHGGLGVFKLGFSKLCWSMSCASKNIKYKWGFIFSVKSTTWWVSWNHHEHPYKGW